MKELIPKDNYGVFADTNDTARVDSLFIARYFEKEHFHVLRDITKITDTKSGLSEVGCMSISKYNSEGYYDPTAYEALTAVEKATKSFRPLVYICSPYSGDIERNSEAARRYSRFAVDMGCIPIAPHLLFPQFMDDSDSAERELGLFFATVLLGKCHKVLVFGSRVSDGMAREISKAKKRGIPIRYFTEKCEEVTA